MELLMKKDEETIQRYAARLVPKLKDLSHEEDRTGSYLTGRKER